MNASPMLERIKSRLSDLGVSPRKASLDAGMGADLIRDIERNPAKSVTIRSIEALARSLKTTPEWLAFGVETDHPETLGGDDYVMIRGEVAAGQWLDISILPHPESWERSPIAYTPEWPRAAQYGLKVKGNSINRRANDGDILRCIDIAIAGIEPIPGDLVIVQQTRFDGAEVEVTAKILRKEGATIVLEPVSTDELMSSHILQVSR